jgi:hypothetical protein
LFPNVDDEQLKLGKLAARMDDGVPLLFLFSFKWRLRRRAFFKRFEARAPVIGDAGVVNANDNVMRALAGMRTRSKSLCLDRNVRSQVKLCGFLDKIFAFKKEKKERRKSRKKESYRINSQRVL